VADSPDGLNEQQRSWLAHSERLWQEAHAIARKRPDLDPGDLYHALRNLEIPPGERLRRGLARGRLGAHRG
jgi:hypothetical protein